VNKRHVLVLVTLIAAIAGMAYYLLTHGFFMHGD
jgi:hypothetical protein